jgi:vancomycin resistance protein YoaR
LDSKISQTARREGTSMLSKIKHFRAALPGSSHSNRPLAQARSSANSAYALLLALAALVLVLTASYGLYNAAHEGRIYVGVRVLGVDLGGKDPASAKAAIAVASEGYPDTGATVQSGEQSWHFTAADLGLSLDVDRTLESAMSIGRTGGLSSLGTVFSSSQVDPVTAYDLSRVDAAVARVSADLDRPAVDSKLERGEDGVFRITSSAIGASVDRHALREAIVEAVSARMVSAVPVILNEIPPQVTEDALAATEAQALVVTGQPIILKYGKTAWTMEAEDLQEMLATYRGPDGSWAAHLDNEKLTGYLAPIAEDVKIEPTDAAIILGKDKVSLREETAGEELDVPAAVAAIQQAALAETDEGRVVDLPLKEIPAAIHTEQIRHLYSKVESLVIHGLRLYHADDGYILRNASAIGFIDVIPAQGGPGPLQLVIDEDVLANRISGVAYNFNRPAADARFRLVGGEPERVAASRTGLKVDVGESLKRAVSAIEQYQGGERLHVELVVNVSQPKVTDADIANIETPDLLGSGQTSYAGSSAERAHNVELGARRIDGSLVPPGGVFSTVDTIGELTLDAGFQMGYMIINTGKEVKTIPAEAGGICQVSTTLFHSVFWSGLEVVERNWHSYWIASYGQAPSGMLGLDSTIAPPEKDFRFRNNTGNWILIRATASQGKISFKIFGVDPGWDVKASDPVITNKVKSNPEPIREKTDQLPKGKEVKVENAQDGFNASITRTVRDKDGNVLEKWTANSRYVPARNRYLIGTGPAQGASGEKTP